MVDWKEVVKALKAIAEGYPTTGDNDCLIVVENPDYQPDRGDHPNLVIEVWEVERALRADAKL